MRYIEWAFLFLLSGLGIALANFVGFHVAFTDSLPGVSCWSSQSLVSQSAKSFR